MMPKLFRSLTLLLISGLLCLAAGCGSSTPTKVAGDSKSSSGGTATADAPSTETLKRKKSEAGLKEVRFPIASDGPRSMDPADGSTHYDNRCIGQIYETLVQTKYLKRPFELEPLLLEKMPEVSDDGLTYHFTLKKGVRFHDDDCFADGKGRELVAEDVIYSIKRLGDADVSLKNWWLVENTIVGFDEYRKTQNDADKFDYDVAFEGLKRINDYEFEVKLVEPVTRFMWVLGMFQTSVVPREAVEKYGTRFARHPVGTGPFTMKEEDWVPKQRMVLNKNPNYHECFYPSESMPEDEGAGLTKAAGKRLPFVDRVTIAFFLESQPMWLEFMSGNLDFTTVPKDNHNEAFTRRWKVKPRMKNLGITGTPVPLLDFIFLGFNMEDPLLGGDSEKNKYLRQAIALSIDWDQRNDVFYNDTARIYDGVVPPGLPGHPEEGLAEQNYRGPDLQRARELLAKAGYPNGEGLPKINYYSSIEGPGNEMAEMTVGHLGKIGIELNPRLDVFSTFIESVNNKKAPLFSFAWGSDYPDPENNMQLFYGPNESPGSNHFNYKNPEFDKLYEQIRVMPPSDERTAIIEKMQAILIEDSPYIGAMARYRFVLSQPWLKNCKPTEQILNTFKYLDIEE